MASMENGLYHGADGCKGGWIVAALDYGRLRFERYDTIGDIIGEYPSFDVFLIDMAIGLRSNTLQERPDDSARKELGIRASTIFSVPTRDAVYADSEERQKESNLRALGKSLSKQTINIIPKIREVDEFMAAFPQYKNRILESHPELDFSRLKGSAILSRKKKAAGMEERIGILTDYLPAGALGNVKAKAKELKCNLDDLVDAVCLAVTAALNAQGLCETIPENPQADERGLYMQMLIPKRAIKKGD